MLLLANVNGILSIKLALLGVLFLVITLIPGFLLLVYSMKLNNNKINFKEKKVIVGIIFLLLSIISFLEIIIFTTIF